MIDSPEQRQRYKNDFNAEYSEYRGLHARIESITRQFTVLDNELKQLQQGTEKYKVDFYCITSKNLFNFRKYLLVKWVDFFFLSVHRQSTIRYFKNITK